ncbi:hypothetical protein [Methylobacterium sp. 13MFTsu3.1M2]|uniref:hypothetical protein n=1 Tax=Methylobacterium sp. 13MFTsu3.1M2 TaxID=1502776 RepID=UPI0008E87CB1|nr:hypothetical protein [Methylobacterium sp. 13MFTsu3.1M2]SFF14630.1 hypothetical protein SAMN02799627_05470 [Methylobacterium sp. 13MFTsu3.1M2]
MISKDLLGCATARNKGTCDHRVNIRRDALEVSILNGLRTHLMEPELLREFCAEFTREVNRLRIERGAELGAKRRELERTERELDKAIDAILAGIPPLKLKAKIETLEGRKAELTAFLGDAQEPPPAASEHGGTIPAAGGEALRQPPDGRRTRRGCGTVPHARRSGDARP